MFTGIIRQRGEVMAATEQAGGMRLTVTFDAELPLGESVAVNGACLTVIGRDAGDYAFDVVPETIAQTTLGSLKPGDGVNIELPLTPRDLLSGHMVSGHVDSLARVMALVPEGEGYRLTVEVAPEVARVTVPKGSITLDGVSLTVAAITGRRVEVAVIPHTFANTTLCMRKLGDALNCEADLIGKYVTQLNSPYRDHPGAVQ